MPRSYGWGAGALLALCAFLLYQDSFSNPFLYDDIVAIRDNALIRSCEGIPHFLAGQITDRGTFRGHFRPLTMSSFVLNYRLSGLDPWGYRLFNWLLHLLNGLLVFGLVGRLLSRFGGAEQRWEPEQLWWAGAVAASLFVLHPITSLSILMVWKRTTLLCAFFYLLALGCYLSWERALFEGAPARRRRLWAAGVVLAFGGSIASKETGITFPALALLLALWPRPQKPEATAAQKQQLWALHGALWAVVAAMLVGILMPKLAQGQGTSPLRYLFTQAQVIWLYLGLFFAPFRIAADYNVQLASFGALWSWVGGLGILALLGLGLEPRLRRRAPLAGFGIWAFFLTLSPTSSLVPNPLLMDENRLYLPLLFGLMGLGALWAVLWSRGTLRWRVWLGVVGALCLVGCGAIGGMRAVVWSDPVRLWRDALAKYPGAPRASYNLCKAYALRPRLAAQASPHCEHAIRSRGRLREAARHLVVSLFAQKRQKEALGWALLAARSYPRDLDLQKLAADASWYVGKPRLAVKLYRRCLGLRAGEAHCRLYLLDSLRQAGQTQAAIEGLQGIQPHQNKDFGLRIFHAYVRLRLGKKQEGCRQFRGLLGQVPAGFVPAPLPWKWLSRECR